MSDPQQDIETIKKKYQTDIDRLDKMLHNMHSVSNIRYIYNYLGSLEVEVTHEFIMLVEALTTALVVGYGRLFTQTNGTTKLKEESVPTELRAIHEEIMSLRHERYAHHGVHPSVSSEINIQSEGQAFLVNLQLDIKVCLGAPKEWAPLFEWLDEFMYETSEKQLAHLSKKSGIEWKMQDGPAPPWIDKG